MVVVLLGVQDPADDFRPDSGTIEVFRTPGGMGIRVDDGPGTNHHTHTHTPRAHKRDFQRVGHCLAVTICLSQGETGRRERGPYVQLVTPCRRWGVGWCRSGFVGANITPFYDSLLVKLTAKAATRHDAVLKLQRALKEFRVRWVKRHTTHTHPAAR